MSKFQIHFSEEQTKALEQMQESGNVQTKKEIVYNALSLLEWAIKETAEGRIIASVNETEKKYKEITMPLLEVVRKTSKKIQTSS